MSSFTDDLKQLAGDSVLVLFGRVATIAGAFVAHTLLVRNLDPGTFGTLALALTVVSVCAGLSVVGMNQTVARFISASNEDANDYVVIGVSVALAGGVLLAAAVVTFRGAIESAMASPGLAELLLALVLLVVLRPLAQVAMGVVRGFERTRWKVVDFDVLPFVLALPVLYHFIGLDRILLGAVLYYLLRPVVQVGLLSLHLYRWDAWTFERSLPTRENVGEVFSFTWPLAFESLVVVFLGSIDVLMLGWFLASESVGYYRSIQPVAKTLLFLLQALTFIYLPIATRYFTNDEYDKFDSIYKTSTRWIAHATFPLFLFYLLFGREFIRVVFTREYVVAWTALAVLSVGMYSRVFAGPNGMTIKAIDRTREDLLATVGALATNFVLNYLLIPTYGIVGAAAATTVGYLVYNAIDLAIIYRYAGISPFHRDLFTPLVPTTVVALALGRVLELQGATFVELLFLGLGLCLVHLVSVVAVTGLTPEDRLLIETIRGG